MSGIIKIVILLGFIFASGLAVFVYWALKPLETDLMATANTTLSGSTVNMSNYFGYAETVNIWPMLGWFALLALIVFGAYLIIRQRA